MRSVPLTGSIAVLFEAREAIGLVLFGQCFDEVIDVAVHAAVQVREVVAKTSIGEAVLREVVRAHLLGALAAADLRVARKRFARLPLLRGACEEARANHSRPLRLVLRLAALARAVHALAGRRVRDPHGGVGRVHARPAFPAGAIDVDLEVVFVDHEVCLFGLRQHRHRRGRRVDAPLCLGRRHALDPMDAGLKLQLRVRTSANDLEDDLFEAALIRPTGGQLLGLPTMTLRVTEVHLVEIASEERGLFPALPGPYFHDDVLFVERIARHELCAKTRRELSHLGRELGDLLKREIAHVGVVPFGELFRLDEALLDVTKRADGLDDRGERRELLADLADAVAVRGGLGRADGAFELLVAALDALESAAQTGGEDLGHAAASASRSPAIASSSDATATSIIRASGRRVVTRCSRRPGATSRRMTGDRSCAAPSRSASYEIDATGMTSARRTTRSTSRLTRGRKAKIAIETTTTSSRNAVPQRGCAVGYGSMRAGVSGSPCSNAWIVMCSAP